MRSSAPRTRRSATTARTPALTSRATWRYRLADAGVLAVVAERRVRGALERTYVLRLTAATVGLDEVAAMSADDHRQAFMAFVAGLLGDFDRYLARGDIDLLRDGVGYRMAGLWLDDAEYAELLRELTRVLQPKLAHPPGPGRKRRILGYVLMPGSEAAPTRGTGRRPTLTTRPPPAREGDEPRADPASPNPTRRNP